MHTEKSFFIVIGIVLLIIVSYGELGASWAAGTGAAISFFILGQLLMTFNLFTIDRGVIYIAAAIASIGILSIGSDVNYATLTAVAVYAVGEIALYTGVLDKGEKAVLSLPKAERLTRSAAEPRIVESQVRHVAEPRIVEPQVRQEQPLRNAWEEPTALAPELPKLLDEVANAGFILIVGQNGSGKTSTLLHIISRAPNLLVFDPHAAPRKWPNHALVIGGGRDFLAIGDYVKNVERKLQKRSEELAKGLVKEGEFEPYTIAMDEMRAVNKQVAGFSEMVATLLTEGRKFGMQMVVVNHTDKVRSLGFEGEGDLREGFVTVRLGKVGKDHYTATVDSGDGQKAVMPTGKYTMPEPLFVAPEPAGNQWEPVGTSSPELPQGTSSPVVPTLFSAEEPLGTSGEPVPSGSRLDKGTTRNQWGTSGEPAGISGEPAGISGEPAGISGVPVGISGEPVGTSGYHLEYAMVPAGLKHLGIDLMRINEIAHLVRSGESLNEICRLVRGKRKKLSEAVRFIKEDLND